MKVFLVVFFILLAVAVYFATPKRGAIVSFVIKNGELYKISYTVRLPRYKFLIKKYPKVYHNNGVEQTPSNPASGHKY